MSQRSVVWICIFVVIALMFWRLPQIVAEQDTVYQTYGVLLEADALIKQRYVHPVPNERLVEGAVRGMLARLDPYCAFIPAEEMEFFERRSRGEYVGVGVEVGTRFGVHTIISPIAGGPAERAGVLAGDEILAIDGRNVESLSVTDIDKLLAGSSESPVALTLRRPGQSQPQRLTVLRGPVSLHTVRGLARDAEGREQFMLDVRAAVGYVRVTDFTEVTLRDFDAALGELTQAGLRGLILDLRKNPGGLMDQALGMADRFLSGGPILATVNRRRVVREYRAEAAGTIGDIPLAVLVDGGSASSSEIVAGSLQARGRAVIIGSRTFGKGSVQHLIPLSDGKSAVKLTVAYYQLPNGRFIHRTASNERTSEWGIIPDIVVEPGVPSAGGQAGGSASGRSVREGAEIGDRGPPERSRDRDAVPPPWELDDDPVLAAAWAHLLDALRAQ